MEKEEIKNKKRNGWTVIFVFPLIWGITGLIQGEGFFPYILKNICALFILTGIALVFFIILFFITRNN